MAAPSSCRLADYCSHTGQHELAGECVDKALRDTSETLSGYIRDTYHFRDTSGAHIRCECDLKSTVLRHFLEGSSPPPPHPPRRRRGQALHACEAAFHPQMRSRCTQGTARLRWRNTANRPFLRALFRQMKRASREGCHRTALELGEGREEERGG